MMKDYKDYKDHKDHKDYKDCKDYKDHKDYKQNQTFQDSARQGGPVMHARAQQRSWQ